jgi:hypothetical protein
MSTYNAAADFYDHPVNTFRERYGQQTVSRLQLKADRFGHWRRSGRASGLPPDSEAKCGRAALAG